MVTKYFENDEFNIEACKKDARSGSIEALIILSSFYKSEEIDITSWICNNMRTVACKEFEDNPEIAIEWLEKAAEKGSIRAMLRLGDLFSREDENYYNKTKAIDWLTKAAKANDISAMLKLSNISNDKRGVEKWITIAEQLIKDGSAEDIFNFAQGLEQYHFEKALYWYKVSSDLGFYKATLQLEIISLICDYRKNKSDDLLLKIIKNIIAMCLEKEEEKITENSKFNQDLGADNLDMFELTYKIEEEFDISIPDEELCDDIEEGAEYSFKFQTVKELFDLCKKYLN